MASILKVDKIRGTGLDSDTISLDGTGNITIPKNVTFSGTVSGDNNTMVLLNTTTISEATAEVAFTNLFDDAYETFIIRGTGITSNAGSDQDDFHAFKARGGSSTYDTDATYGTKINTHSNANSNYSVNGGFSETKWEMTPSGHLDATEAVPLQFQMTLPDPKGTTAGGRAFNYYLT